MEHSVNQFHNADAVFNCLINSLVLENLILELLKDLAIDEASVMGDKHNVVAVSIMADKHNDVAAMSSPGVCMYRRKQ